MRLSYHVRVSTVAVVSGRHNIAFLIWSGLRSEDRGKGAGGVRQQSERSLLSQHLVPHNILLLEHSPLQEILNDSSVPKPQQSRHHVIHQAEQVYALHDSQRLCQDVHLEVQHGLREDG